MYLRPPTRRGKRSDPVLVRRIAASRGRIVPPSLARIGVGLRQAPIAVPAARIVANGWGARRDRFRESGRSSPVFAATEAAVH